MLPENSSRYELRLVRTVKAVSARLLFTTIDDVRKGKRHPSARSWPVRLMYVRVALGSNSYGVVSEVTGDLMTDQVLHRERERVWQA